MAITTYALLQAAVLSAMHRTGDTTVSVEVPNWISLAEAEMQPKLKLLEFETTATVTITSGSGTLPTGFVGMRSVYWDSDPDRPLSYVTPSRYDELRVNDSGDGYYYTISGSTIRTTPMGSGSIVCTYNAKFTALSDLNTSNAILADFPNAYLYGTLKHANVWTEDDNNAKKYAGLFDMALDDITKNNEDRKFAGDLTVRAR